MTLIPEGVKAPQDHKAKIEPVLSDDEILAGMPELKPPHRLRIRDRNKFMKLALGMRSIIPDTGADDAAIEFDMDDLDDEQLGKMLDIFAGVDDIAESIALNPEAYVAWAETASHDAFAAILSRYSSAVGESSSSSS